MTLLAIFNKEGSGGILPVIANLFASSKKLFKYFLLPESLSNLFERSSFNVQLFSLIISFKFFISEIEIFFSRLVK